MRALRLEVHLDRTEERVETKICPTINAFGRKFHFHGIVRHTIVGKEVVAVYLPRGDK